MSSICFSVIDSCSHFSPPAFGRALCSAELCQCLQSLELCLCSSCLCPAACSILATASAFSAPWDTLLLGSSAGIPSFHPVPCSCAAANCAWGGLEHLQVCLAQDEWLSFQSAYLQQVIPGSQVVFCISYCSNKVAPWCSAGTKGSAHWFLQTWLPS